MRLLTFVLLFVCFAGSAHAQEGTAHAFNGKELKLKKANGDYIILRDGNCEHGFEGCVVHKLRGTIADDQFYVVDVNYYEGGQTELFSSKSGKRTVIYDTPHLSPRQDLMATAFGSEGHNTENNGVYLFQITNGEAKEIFRYKPDSYAMYGFDHWVSNHEAIVNRTTVCSNADIPEWLTVPVRLINTASGWQLDQGRAAECTKSGER